MEWSIYFILVIISLILCVILSIIWVIKMSQLENERLKMELKYYKKLNNLNELKS